MNRLLSDSYRRSIDNRISKIIISHKAARPGKVMTVLSRTNPSIRFQELTEKDAHLIYNKKCNDLEIAPNPLAEQRFIEQFMNSLLIKTLKFGGLGLGPEAAKILLQVIWDQKKYFYLDLSLNRLSDSGATFVAEYIKSRPPIIHLDLRSNCILVKGAISIFQALEDNDTIVSLDFSAIDGIDRNKIGTQGCRFLSQLLQKNDIISHLNLSMSGISADGCLFLSTALSSNKSLIHLDLSINRFGTQGAVNLFKEDNSLSSLEYLNLSRNGIGDGISQTIGRQIELSKSIRVLDFTDNNLTKNFLRKLYRPLLNSSITTLLLSRNKFESNSGDILHNIVRDVVSLEVIDLSNNPLKDSAVIDIADSLVDNNNIISIDFTDTAITDESAVRFSEVIETNTCLQRLNLSNNQITDVSSVFIAQSIAKNKTLLHLSLKSNEIGDLTAPFLIESMQQNNTIIDIDIDFNDFTYRTHVQLSDAIGVHKKSITKNIANIASKKIEILKNDEKRLFEVREEVKKQSDLVSASIAEKGRKEEMLREMSQQREADIVKYDKRLEEVKKEYEKISEERRIQLVEFNKVKTQTESEQAAAQRSFQSIAAKRQHAAARLKRANDKKIECEIATNRVLDDLKLHLFDLKDQLRQAIDDAHVQQKLLFQKEEEERQAKQAARLMDNVLNKKKDNGSLKKKKVAISKRKKSLTSIKSMPNVESQIVTPTLNMTSLPDSKIEESLG